MKLSDEIEIEHNQIILVKRIYFETDGGDCHYFDPGEVYMATIYEPTIDSEYSAEPIYPHCFVVALGGNAPEKFKDADWDSFGSFWIAVEDTEPVSEDIDAQIRAIVALTGKVADADLLKAQAKAANAIDGEAVN